MAEPNKSPGWYPAPDGDGQRWWNGAGWSDARQPVVYSASNPAPQDPSAVRPGLSWGNAIGTTVPGRTINASVNKFAFYGFLMGIISVFFNLLFLLAPMAIIFSLIGLTRARELKAEGAPSTLAGMAAIGLATGAISMAIALIGLITFFASALG